MESKGVMFEGKTLDDAVRKGLEALGLSRAEVMIQVMEEGSSGFLGLGARPYRVRMMPRPRREMVERGERSGRRETPDRTERRGRGDRAGRGGERSGRGDRGGRGGRGERAAGDRETRPRREGRPPREGAPAREAAPRMAGPSRESAPGREAPPREIRDRQPLAPVDREASSRDEGAPADGRRRRRRRGRRDEGAAPRPARTEASPMMAEDAAPPPHELRDQPHEFRESEEQAGEIREPREERAPREFREPRPDRAPREFRDDRGSGASAGNGLMPPEELAATARQLAEDFFKAMGFEARLTATADGDSVEVRAEIPQDGDLIAGEKGEVRQSIQHLLNRMLNRGGSSRYHLQLEVNDFWAQREQELQRLARTLAEEAVSDGAEKLTEYLNAQERRVVHVALRDDVRVKTYGLGDGLIKKVAIAPVSGNEVDRPE